MRYFIRLSYKGTNYRGWQRQVEDSTVQEILEAALHKMFKSTIGIMGCGRTDAGVHARQFYAHFEYDLPLSFDLMERSLRTLPEDIVIHELIPMHQSAHSRFDALDRTYHYYLHTIADPMLSEVSSYFKLASWDKSLVNIALERLQQRIDFRHLCLTPDKNANTRCLIKEVSVVYNSDGSRMMFSFKSSRFLKSMIRIIIARIIDLGTGKITLEDFDSICNGEIELKYNRLAPPNGLHLIDVTYPYLHRNPVTSSLDDGLR